MSKLWLTPPAASPHDVSPTALAAPQELYAGGSSWLVQEGSWRVEGDALLGQGGQVISSAMLGDGTLAVDFEIVAGPGKRSVGIGFRAQPVSDRDDGSGYGANFRLGTNTFNLFKGAMGRWDPIDPAYSAYHPSPAVNPQKNHVEIRTSGASCAITVNGQPLAGFVDETYRSGRITLWVESPKETVRFSNFRVVNE